MSYPVRVGFDREARYNRFWGIPLIGWFVRGLVLLPHWIVLWIFGVVAGIAIAFLIWIPVLFTGRMADWGYSLVGGYLRYAMRIVSYFSLLGSPYPPFSLSDSYPVAIDIDRDQSVNRLWGIPIVGLVIRGIILIPHFIVLWILGVVASILLFFAWIPVLFLGRQAGLVYDLVGAFFRYGTRVTAYLYLLNDRYPPFRLGD